MSTESGKTCGCTVTHFFATTSGKYEIAYCPLHDGSMAEKLAEALRDLIAEGSKTYVNRVKVVAIKLLEAYEASK